MFKPTLIGGPFDGNTFECEEPILLIPVQGSFTRLIEKYMLNAKGHYKMLYHKYELKTTNPDRFEYKGIE